MTVLRALLATLAAAARAIAQDTEIEVPLDLDTRILLPDVYGYSIEPVWLEFYLATPMTANLLSIVANVTGKPPPIRIGGNTADQTYQHATLPTGNDSVSIPSPAEATQFNITPHWYETWADYFPEDTDLIYTLNLAVNDSSWSNAVAQAEAAHAALGDKLVLFELGNEIDHFINKGWRDSDWGIASYLAQFRNLTGQITSSDWYAAAEDPPLFQAGVFADPPWVPDQHDEVDDFSIANLTAETAARASDRAVIGGYATHMYPQSTCDEARWLRLRLDLLSDHEVLWRNVSQYVAQAAAAEAAGSHLVMGETNSVSCSGKSGISDTFGAALWAVDYVLLNAAVGIRKTYFHLGAQSEYSAFTPAGYEYELKNETLRGGIRAGFYAHYFLAKVVGGGREEGNEDEDGDEDADEDDNENETETETEGLSIAALPGANSSDLAGYAIFSAGGQQNFAKQLKKLVLLDMGVWNGTEGLGNPSTLRATDGEAFSEGDRPGRALRVATPWCAGRSVGVTRLTAPGTNAKSGVRVSGVAFDMLSGDKVGEEVAETLVVGEDGVLEVGVVRAEGVLLEVGSGGSDCGGGGEEGNAGDDAEGDTEGDTGEGNTGTDGGSDEQVPEQSGIGQVSVSSWVSVLIAVVASGGVLVL